MQTRSGRVARAPEAETQSQRPKARDPEPETREPHVQERKATHAKVKAPPAPTPASTPGPIPAPLRALPAEPQVLKDDDFKPFPVGLVSPVKSITPRGARTPAVKTAHTTPVKGHASAESTPATTPRPTTTPAPKTPRDVVHKASLTSLPTDNGTTSIPTPAKSHGQASRSAKRPAAGYPLPAWIALTTCTAMLLLAAISLTTMCHKDTASLLPPTLVVNMQPVCEPLHRNLGSVLQQPVVAEMVRQLRQLGNFTAHAQHSTSSACQATWRPIQMRLQAAAAHLQHVTTCLHNLPWGKAFSSQQLGSHVLACFHGTTPSKQASSGDVTPGTVKRHLFSEALPEGALQSLVLQGGHQVDLASIYEVAQQRQGIVEQSCTETRTLEDQAEASMWGAQVGGLVKVPKAMCLLLACRTPEACQEALDSLTAAVNPKTHALVVDGRQYGPEVDSAGRLQALLATFLTQAPGGVVVMHHTDDFGLGSTAVLNNVMSEGGGLQRDGRSVPSTSALFVYLVQTTSNPQSADFDMDVKEHMQAGIASRAEDPMDTTPAVLAVALRRRFEFVLASISGVPMEDPAPAPAAEPVPTEAETVVPEAVPI